MKIKFGAIVVDGRNKIGGHVASANKYGNYLRTKVTPMNPKTVNQNLIRSRLTDISQSWRELTQAQRDAWNNAVTDYKKTDIFGDIKNPSGFTLFQRLNNNLSIIGATPLTSPPLPQETSSLTSLSVAVKTGVPTVTITFNPPITAVFKAKLYATPPLSPGKNFVKSEYRLIGVLDSTSSSPFDATALYTARFGNVGETGQKIFFAVQLVTVATGQTGGRISASCISTAS